MEEVKYIVIFEPYGDMWQYYGPFDTEEGARKSIMDKANEFCLGLKHGTVEVVSDNNPFQVEVLDEDEEEAHQWHIEVLLPVDKES